ncbi:Uncharacterised protein [Mycobacteroides abscessus subsp. abscessus]|nr:Uncharacterised protein [Mycobacteroides abscessus subsp. abscessus]
MKNMLPKKVRMPLLLKPSMSIICRGMQRILHLKAMKVQSLQLQRNWIRFLPSLQLA